MGFLRRAASFSFLFLFFLPLKGEELQNKKKILILFCEAGNGHVATVEALIPLLKERYEVVPFSSAEEVLPGYMGWHNRQAAKGNVRLLNWNARLAKFTVPLWFSLFEGKIKTCLERVFAREKPSLVISVMSSNFPILKFCHEKKIPFLIISTDNDLRHWVHCFEAPYYGVLQMTIGRDLPYTREYLQKHYKIPEERLKTIGFPVKEEFKIPKDKEELKKKYRIPLGKPVVLCMSGGLGSDTMVEYLRAVGAADLGIHLLVCCGKNQGLFSKVSSLPLHPSNSLEAIGFTEKIADYMTVSDVFITKPGTISVEEAIAKRLPMLIDATQGLFLWERATADFLVQSRVGRIVSRSQDFASVLSQYLRDPKLREEIRAAYEHLPRSRFMEEIGLLVDEWIGGP